MQDNMIIITILGGSKQMLKRIHKQIFIVLIISLFLQLFVGVTPVMAEDLSDQNTELIEEVGENIVEESEFVQPLEVNLSTGTTTGAISATIVEGIKPMAVGQYSYLDENGETKYIGTDTVIKVTPDTNTLDGGWYIVEGNVNRNSTINVNGDVHLILLDSSSLTVEGDFEPGINVSGDNSLTIYGQSNGDKMGYLNATGGNYCAGIGGECLGTCGNVTINSGKVIATGGDYGAGIGGGEKSNCGNIIINNGTVIATGGNSGAGIGRGDYGNGGKVIINSGTVISTGGENGAGIGGGYADMFNPGNPVSVTINGGEITATGGHNGAGIGGGYYGTGGNIIINNYPTVIATGKDGSADIGNGKSAGGTTTIKRGGMEGTDLTYVRLEVINLIPDYEHKIILGTQEYQINKEGLTGFFATKSTDSISIDIIQGREKVDIVPGYVQYSRITLDAKYPEYPYIDENGEMKKAGGKNVTKVSSDVDTLNSGWYIAEGDVSRNGTITVNGDVHLILLDSSSLTVGGNSFNAGINVSGDNSLTIYGQSNGDKMGYLNATGGKNGAGIGSGYDGTGGKVTINGGKVTATGGEYGAGIGGGFGGTGGNVTIYNGTVTATGGYHGAGIGGGHGGTGGNVTINNGTVMATGGYYGAGIGGGYNSAGGNVTINNGTVITTGGGYGAGIGGGYYGKGGNIIINNYPTVIAAGKDGSADIGNGNKATGTTAIKRGDAEGVDLTYVRLEVINLIPGHEHRIILDTREYQINSEGRTGFFITKSTESISLDIEPAGKKINIKPGDVQNSRITLDAIDYSYIDENGVIKDAEDKNVTKVTSNTYDLNEGWYIVKGDVNRNDGITVNGDVHLILADSSSLTVKQYIKVIGNNSLTIYAQSNGYEMGLLNAKGGQYSAGIGGGAEENCGKIVINGGRVTATGGYRGAGIGGGYTYSFNGKGGKVTINNGTVIAESGIGGGAGIGGGHNGDGEEIIINGGTVIAASNGPGAGIGGGINGHGGSVTLSGGKITATGGAGGAGIGAGAYEYRGNVIIKNEAVTVIATGSAGAADIGSGKNTGGSPYTIKRGDAKGTDLTYTRLQLQNLPHDSVNKIYCNVQEYEVNSEGITGFFVEKSTESINIRVKPEGALIKINPGYVQNSRIILDVYNYEKPDIKPVAGFGNGLVFSGNSKSTIHVPSNNETKISGQSDFTISMWIFPDQGSPYQTLYRQFNNTGSSLGLWLRYIKSDEDEGYIYFGFDKSFDGWQWVWDWNDGIPPSYVDKIPSNRWTHIAFTKSGKVIMVYVNGTKYSEMTLNENYFFSIAPKGGSISIGGSDADDQFFDGRMDEIQFWNTALTSAEIKAWMYREIDTTHSRYNALVYYYKLNQSSGNSIMDSKGSNYGTAVYTTDSNWVNSDVQGWKVYAGEKLNGRLVGSYELGTSSNGYNWNLNFEIVDQGKKGTARITGDNAFEYITLDRNQEGHDSFTYRVRDRYGGYSNTYTVNIDIRPEVNFGTYPPDNSDSASRKKPAGLEILVNGKSERVATTTSTREGDKTITTVVLDDNKVEEQLSLKGNGTVFTIPVGVGSDIVIGTLNGHTVKNMADKEAVLEIKTEQYTYTLPASQMDIDAVSDQLGKQVDMKDIEVSVKVSEPSSETVKIMEDTANKNNYQIVVKPVEFEISCTSGDKTVRLSRFNAYVERMIAIPEGIDLYKISTGIVLNDDGTFFHVPTAIVTIDGKHYAKINSLSNSIYSVIYCPKVFKDLENHWAKKEVQDMTSRLIISGVGEDLFQPERSITRAEFSAIMVRALGLKANEHSKEYEEEYNEKFSDIKSSEWYTEDIKTISHYNLVKGYGDGTFKPDGNITRQEAMTILVRAMTITKLGEENRLVAGEILTAFSDDADVSNWAKDSVEKCIETGIVSGRDAGKIAPQENITRAEAVVMVRRLLVNSDLINK